MSKITEQMAIWNGEFGKSYTDRNAQSLEEMEVQYEQNYGITRTGMNEKFLSCIDHSSRILEIGSNIGLQLLCLQKMGFTNLYGIELQSYAVEISKSRTKNINIIQGEASDIPFKNSYFDMVFTTGVLIHIAPSDLTEVMKEIHRCTEKYIFGFEYYSEKTIEVTYRGNKNLLWKTDFEERYIELFEDLCRIKKENFKYRDGENVDCMFLLEKA